MVIKCEVIERFTLMKFNELKNIKRKSINEDGTLFVGDTFECDKDMAEYLLGNNKNNRSYIKVIEVIPNRVSKKIK